MLKILFLCIVLFFMNGCAAPVDEFGRILGCTSKGTNCNSQGAAGADGLTIVGPQGPQGVPGTSVTVVKLCPGNTVYPTVFVEIAFCISSKLYATYSTHGGFSTEIPPGRYSSNAVGSRCAFTVHANCQVTP